MYEYVIWSFDHAAWWAPRESGYTKDLDKAGRYNATDAGRIVTSSIWCDEVAVLASIAAEKGAPQFHAYAGSSGCGEAAMIRH